MDNLFFCVVFDTRGSSCVAATPNRHMAKKKFRAPEKEIFIGPNSARAFALTFAKC